MKSSKINYVMVGSFVLAMIVGLVVSLAVLTGRTGATDSYYAIYKNVTGIKFGTQVLYEGYPIGQVTEVTPQPEDGRMRFRVDFDVTKGWRIPGDSVAQIAAPGLLSAITLSIKAGEGPALEPGGRVKEQESANVLAVLSGVAADMGELAETRIKPLIANVERTVVALGNLLEADAPVLIRDLAALVRDVAERMPRIADNVEDFTGKLNRSSDELAALMTPKNREKLEGLIGNMDTAARNLARLSVNFEKTRADIDRLLASMSATVAKVSTMVTDNKLDIEKSIINMRYVVDSLARHIDSINQNMEGAARNMYEFTRQIRQNPGLLLGGRPPRDEAATQ